MFQDSLHTKIHSFYYNSNEKLKNKKIRLSFSHSNTCVCVVCWKNNKIFGRSKKGLKNKNLMFLLICESGSGHEHFSPPPLLWSSEKSSISHAVCSSLQFRRLALGSRKTRVVGIIFICIFWTKSKWQTDSILFLSYHIFINLPARYFVWSWLRTLKPTKC